MNETIAQSSYLKCEEHGLTYDSQTQSGCILCRKKKSKTNSKSSPDSMSLTKIAIIGLTVTLCVVGAILFLSGRTRSLELLVVCVGLILIATGAIGFLIQAFRASVVWGLGCIFFPIISVIFLFKFFDETHKPFLMNIAGAALIYLSKFIHGL